MDELATGQQLSRTIRGRESHLAGPGDPASEELYHGIGAVWPAC